MAWLEGTALATWTRESPSIWAYPTILTLHTVGLGIVVGASAVIDFRLLGFAPRISLPSLLATVPDHLWAFVLNAATGVLLFMSDATDQVGQPVFYIKLDVDRARAVEHDHATTPWIRRGPAPMRRDATRAGSTACAVVSLLPVDRRHHRRPSDGVPVAR